MYPGYACIPKSYKLFLVEKSKRNADLDIHCFLNFTDSPAHLINFLIAKAPSRCHDRIAQHPAPGIIDSLIQDLFGIHKRIFYCLCMIEGGLRAILAVLRTPAAFSIDDRTDIKPVFAIMPPDLVRSTAKFF